MSETSQKSNRLIQGVALVLAALLLFPFILMGGKMLQTYTELKDVRFQSEKLLRQEQVLSQELRLWQVNLSASQRGFKPLDGSRAQANATLQAHLRTLIRTVGGNIETSSQVKTRSDVKAGTASSLRPISVNIRWSATEEGLGKFLANGAASGRNLKIDSFLIRRRQGTASLLDIRMQCSALWRDPTIDSKENGQ